MKRFAALFCVLLLVCQFPMTALAASRPKLSPEATLSDDGRTVTVTVSVTGGSALCGGSFDIAFDSDSLTCESLVAGGALAGSAFMGNANYSKGVVRCGWIGITGLSSDGVAAVASFSVLPEAEGKTLDFSITGLSAYDTAGSPVDISAGRAEIRIPGSAVPSVPSVPSVPDMGDRDEPEEDQEAFLMEFVDVAKDAYYYDAVKWAVEKGITTGTSETTFSPEQVCTRGQAVTFLWRAAGSPTPTTTTCPFTDVSSTAYYYKAVLWALEKGITTGTSETAFSPDAEITRSQTVAFLYRAAGSPVLSWNNSGFSDVASGAWYKDAVIWAVAKGVTTGTSETAFSPDNLCTRGQIVTFLYRT